MTEPELLDEADLQRVWRGVTRTRARNTQRRRLLAASLASAVVSAIGEAIGPAVTMGADVPPEEAGVAPLPVTLVLDAAGVLDATLVRGAPEKNGSTDTRPWVRVGEFDG